MLMEDKEIMLLALFRSMDDRRREEIFELMKLQARDYPAQVPPPSEV